MVLCTEPVPDHFDRDCPRFRFGLLLTAVYLALLIMQAAAAFYNVEMITWHRKHHCSPDIIIPVVSTGRPKPLFMGLVHFVNAAGSVLVAPYGGVERRLSTAPYCVGIPRQGQRPIVLDFATSIVAEGKVLVASRGGKKLPKGALIDLEGTLSEDPAVLYGPHSAEEPRDHSQGKGAIRAFGEHKGSGLAFICELLGGALTGTGATGPNRRFANGMFAVYVGKVDDWRGGCRSRGVAVVRRLSPNAGASFRTVAPFPVAARQTGRAELPHPAFSHPIRPSLSAGRSAGGECGRGRASHRDTRPGSGGTRRLVSQLGASTSGGVVDLCTS